MILYREVKASERLPEGRKLVYAGNPDDQELTLESAETIQKYMMETWLEPIEITEDEIKGMAAEFATDKMGGYPAFPQGKKFHTEWSKIFNVYSAGAKAILSKLKGDE